MKKQIITTLAIALVTTSITFSCKKKNDTTPEPTTTTTGGPTPTNGSFMWQENGGSVINADSAFWVSGTTYTGIRAFKGGYANWLEINWNGANDIGVGPKTSGLGIDYIKSSTIFSGTSNTLNITTSTNSLISGNLSAAVSNATNTSITAISATFTSLNKK